MPIADQDTALRAQSLALRAREAPTGPSDLPRDLERFCGLIRKWNPVASLVSFTDEHRLWTHIADSLSLARAVERMGGKAPRLLDIGSGAGFPAIPLALAVPALECVLIERARKKAGFLEIAIGELGLLNRIGVVQGAFPQETRLGDPSGWLITARAIERPTTVWRSVRGLVENGAVLLCQWAELPKEAEAMFHVEQITDDWTHSKLRRGALFVIRSR